jgi:hypothetical protein
MVEQSRTTNGPRRARPGVQGARDQLLAGAGLAVDEDAQLVALAGQALEHGEQLAHHVAAAVEVLEVVEARQRDLDLVGRDELQGGLADLKDGVRVEPGRLDAHAADEDAVHAAEVGEQEALVERLELEVVGADVAVGQDDVVDRVASAADGLGLLEVDGELAPGVGTGDDAQQEAAEAAVARRQLAREGGLHQARGRYQIELGGTTRIGRSGLGCGGRCRCNYLELMRRAWGTEVAMMSAEQHDGHRLRIPEHPSLQP